MRVLYFTVVPLGATGNGGSICCRNNVRRLAADPDIELFAMVAGPLAGMDSTSAFFESLKTPHHYLPFREANVRHSRNTLGSIAKFAEQMVFQFPWEVQSLNQPHIEEGIAWAIKGYSIDVLVIDYHPSTLFIDLPRTDVRTALISLNREGDFYADQMRLGQVHHGSLTAGISLRRLRRWERHTDAAVDQVITIGPADLPKHPVRRPPVCISPYLDQQQNRWTYSATKRVFFVGAIGHYPNRLAIEWLTQKLAPVLLGIDSEIRIAIVGAADTDIGQQHHHPNIDLLGYANAEVVASLFKTSDIMICPVENDYGVKFKSLEALAYGTPLLASRQTMMGLPHLAGTPSFDLEDVEGTAALLERLVGDGDALKGLAEIQQRRQDDFIRSQDRVWSRALGALLGAGRQTRQG